MRLLFIMLLFSQLTRGQEESLARIMEDQASQEDVKEVEEDLLQIRMMGIKPLDINTATAEQLHVFPFLTALQIEQFMQYRKFAGSLIDIKELQAVPGWDVQTIHKLKSYIFIDDGRSIRESFSESLRKGKHQWLTRFTLSGNSGLLIRYHFNSPQFEWGLNVEKDAGERLWQGAKGISFMSAHAVIRNIGSMKLLVVGDYILNLGQGLTVWQGRAVRKTGMPILVKRQLPILMPYRSNDENRYFRGAAAWFARGKLEWAFFLSSNKLDANTKTDSSSGLGFVTSFLNTGYHRTVNELEDKNAVGIYSTGGTLSLGTNRSRVTVSSVMHFFSLPIIRSSLPYNLFAAKGDRLSNHAMSFHHTWRNIHFFGEVAIDREGDPAGLGGMMMAADAKLDLSLVVRKISRGYWSFFANAFTESSEPANEEGIYTGLSLKLSPRVTLDAYADHYRFPWLRYRIDAPGWGRDYLLQLSYNPDKRTKIFFRYSWEEKSLNQGELSTKTIGNIPRSSFRFHIQQKVLNDWEWRARVESNRVGAAGKNEWGFLTFFDLFWNPSARPFSLNLRTMLCETTSYESRVYAFENDVMFYNIVPAFFGDMGRIYLNAGFQLTKTTKVFAKFSKSLPGGAQGWLCRMQLLSSL